MSHDDKRSPSMNLCLSGHAHGDQYRYVLDGAHVCVKCLALAAWCAPSAERAQEPPLIMVEAAMAVEIDHVRMRREDGRCVLGFDNAQKVLRVALAVAPNSSASPHEALANRLANLLPFTTPADQMPVPWDQDRRYSDTEISRLDANKRVMAMLPEILAALRGPSSAKLAQVPEGWALVPAELTAENGMKFHMSGDWSVRVDEEGHEVVIPWDTIKQIHRDIEERSQRLLARSEGAADLNTPKDPKRG